MEAQVLVLDSGYQPTGRTTWEQAITMIVKRVVEVIDEYPDKQVRSANWSPQLPSVIRLLKPVHKKRAVKFSRYGVYQRDNGRCQYCWMRLSMNVSTYDHVIPRSRGGRTEWGNVIIACVPCNQRKANRTPDEAGMKLRSTPVKPKKLPAMTRPIVFNEGMPSSWRSWLRDATRDAVYWDGALDEE